MADLPLTPVECLEMLVAETGVRGYLLSGDTLLLTDGQFFKCPPIGTCHPKTKKGILRELHIKNEPVMLN
jgi:hypothetical protein